MLTMHHPSSPRINPDGKPTVHPLKLARLNRNLTQQMLADFTGLGYSTIQRAEAGLPTSIIVHHHLCTFFGQTPEELGLHTSELLDSRPDAESTIHPLKRERIRHQLTQQMLADATQISISTIQRAEEGRPTRTYVRQQLCSYFGKTAEDLGLRPYELLQSRRPAQVERQPRP